MDYLLFVAIGIVGVIIALWCYGRFKCGSWIGGSFGAKVLNLVASTGAKTKYAFPYTLSVYALDADSQDQPQVGLMVEAKIPSRSTYRRMLKLSVPQALALSKALTEATVPGNV